MKTIKNTGLLIIAILVCLYLIKSSPEHSIPKIKEVNISNLLQGDHLRQFTTLNSTPLSLNELKPIVDISSMQDKHFTSNAVSSGSIVIDEKNNVLSKANQIISLNVVSTTVIPGTHTIKVYGGSEDNTLITGYTSYSNIGCFILTVMVIVLLITGTHLTTSSPTTTTSNLK